MDKQQDFLNCVRQIYELQQSRYEKKLASDPRVLTFDEAVHWSPPCYKTENKRIEEIATYLVTTYLLPIDIPIIAANQTITFRLGTHYKEIGQTYHASVTQPN